MVEIKDGRNLSLEQILSMFERPKQTSMPEQEATVLKILSDVQEQGDNAVVEYTKKFDYPDMTINQLYVSEQEIEDALKEVSPRLVQILEKAYGRILAFHEKQKRETWQYNETDGITLGQKISPIERAGVYVPGGRAVYPSSVLMNVAPAVVAGVKEIIMVSPPETDGRINSTTLVAAKIAGVNKIVKVGGAQAIAALAYGTEKIPPVDKITGPGNVYVAIAKKRVFGFVDIDMIAGPSEVVVIADESAKPAYVAADLMSQAEHDPLAMSILLTDSMELANKVKQEIEKQAGTLKTEATIKQSLKSYGALIVCDNIEMCATVSNQIAPEHLELSVANPDELFEQIDHAGAVFLGHYSPEPLGDYFAGPNHVLPTGGTARFSSPLGVDDFIKKTSIIKFDRKNLNEYWEDIYDFAQSEGLEAHANSMKVRFED